MKTATLFILYPCIVMSNHLRFAANFDRTYPVRTLRVLVALLEDILSHFFAGYVMIESEPLNTVYVRLLQRVEELASPYPEVREALLEFSERFPNLHESVDDPDVPEAKWEFGQDVVRRVRGRVSELHARTVPIDEEISTDPRSITAILLREDGALEVWPKSAKR